MTIVMHMKFKTRDIGILADFEKSCKNRNANNRFSYVANKSNDDDQEQGSNRLQEMKPENSQNLVGTGGENVAC